MSMGMPIEICERCGRPAIVCRRRSIAQRQDDPERSVERVVCDALHRVVALQRFDPASQRPFLSEDARVVGSNHRLIEVRLSHRTVALMREWQRSLKDERYSPVERHAVCMAIETEVVQQLLAEHFDVDLDATIGDLCPRCKREKTADEGARDYWCQSCMDVAREEVES